MSARQFLPFPDPDHKGGALITDDTGTVVGTARSMADAEAILAGPSPSDRKVNVFVTACIFLVLWVAFLTFALCGRAHGEEMGPPAPKDPRAQVVTVGLADAMARHAFVVGIGSAADLFSTSAALHWCSTCSERNPGGWDAEARISLKLGLASFVLGWEWFLESRGHHGWATALSWIFLGQSALFTTSNAVHAIRGF